MSATTTRRDGLAAFHQAVSQLVFRGRQKNRTTHRQEFDEGFWATWLRLYVPAGARALAIEGSDTPPTVEAQSGRALLTAHLDLPAVPRRVAVDVSEDQSPQSLPDQHALRLAEQAADDQDGEQ